MSTVAEALKNLELLQYSSIRAIFGKVLVKRSEQKELRCTLFNWLATRAHPLELLNGDCVIYIAEIGLPDAQRKCNSDVLGNVGRPFVDFNGSCADFWAEMAAIRVLRDSGYSQFRAIHKKLADGTTSDYEACRRDAPAYIEVKNMRPNKTIFDTFDKEIRRRYEMEPSKYAFNVAVDYPYDNRPTGEQEGRILGFLESIRGRKPPFHETLDLVEAIAHVNIREGRGTVLMTRGVGSESPEPLDKARFLSKIRDKAGEALSQMKDVNRMKVLVINFDSPSGSISADFIGSAQEVIRGVFNGAVDPYVLLYRHLRAR